MTPATALRLAIHARHVTDPALRAAHPELAPSVPGRFAAAVARLLAGLRAEEAPPAPTWGLLGAEVSVAVARDAVLGVVEPCLEAALGR